MNNLGIFINRTDSNLKLNINEHNYNILHNNFDSVIISDIESVFSNNLKKKINNHKIHKYIRNEEKEYLSKLKNIVDKLKDINYDNINYITFILDDYIYLNNLIEYFNYINDHELDFYSFSDSTDNIYHYELYTISVKSTRIHNFIEYISSGDCDNIYSIDKIFIKKMPFLKIAYIPGNIDKNIFFNDEIYKELLNVDLLPIININKLLKIKNSYKYLIFNDIPENFDMTIYRSHEDLKNLSDDNLNNNFLNYGQFEFRRYT